MHLRAYWPARGEWVRSDERYYLARTGRTDVVRDAWTALERATIAEYRGWSAAGRTSGAARDDMAAV